MTYVQYLAWSGFLGWIVLIFGGILISPYLIYRAIRNYRFNRMLKKQNKEKHARIREQFRKEGLIPTHRTTDEEVEEFREEWRKRTGI